MKPTLRSIAMEAGVCTATVSYALKNSPKISQEMRERILAIAERLGYRPNPQIATLMAHIRSGRAATNAEKVAIVWMEPQEDARRSPYLARCWQGASQQAARLGYEIEEFWMKEQGMSARRLEKIFEARGIRGVIFGPITKIAHTHLSMDWSRLSAVTLGNALWHPRLHRSKFDHYHGVVVALHQAKRHGYKRPGLVLDALQSRRSDHRYAGAFSQMMRYPAKDEKQAVLMPPQSALTPETLKRWISKFQPDVIISGHAACLGVLEKLGVQMPEQLGFITLDWQPFEPDTTGVDQQYEDIAANGVRLIIHQLQYNETGIPRNPILMNTEGSWRSGKTTRTLPRLAKAVRPTT